MALKRSIPMRNALLDTNSFKGLFDQGVLILFSGTTPSASGSTPAASVAVGASDKALLVMTNSAAAYSAAANGLTFSSAASGYIVKAAAETWQATGKSSGTVAYFRFFPNTSSIATNIVGTIGSSGSITNASLTANTICFQGTCGPSGDLQMVTTTVSSGATSTIDQFKLTLPE